MNDGMQDVCGLQGRINKAVLYLLNQLFKAKWLNDDSVMVGFIDFLLFLLTQSVWHLVLVLLRTTQ